jgi:polysaccharide biosynthesis protein PslH
VTVIDVHGELEMSGIDAPNELELKEESMSATNSEDGMRILVLTQVVVYPADAGPKIKTLHVIQHLAKSHKVIYCTFVRNVQEQGAAEQLHPFCSRIATVLLKRSRLSDLRYLLQSVLTDDSFLLCRDDLPAMQAMVRQLLREEEIDVLHVDQLNMMRFVPSDWPGMIILDEHNAVWQVIERLRTQTRNPLLGWLLKREVRLIRKIEGQACQRAHTVLAVSEQDRQALLEVIEKPVTIDVVPISVDAGNLDSIRRARQPRPNQLLTIGTMFWPPNSEGVGWWLRQGHELLRAMCPDLNLSYDIVGARPPRWLRRLVARHQTHVHIHGYVADTTPFWLSATILIVPLLSGGGVRVKILEAMAMGVPVVSTTLGCEGLDVQDDKHLLIADTPLALAQACTRLLRDPELATRLAYNAHCFILERYDVKVALHRLDMVYQRQLLPGHSAV